MENNDKRIEEIKLIHNLSDLSEILELIRAQDEAADEIINKILADRKGN